MMLDDDDDLVSDSDSEQTRGTKSKKKNETGAATKGSPSRARPTR